jgi:cystathionine beta-lyase/cystathionine gamma-synthase
MRQTNENAQVIADYLEAHPKVKRTSYPGLKSHPHHALATKQMRGYGGLISFDVGSLDAAKTVLNRLRLMALAESLGGVETLISHPAIMTHASVPKDRRDMLGITDGLIRISVGIEDVEDLQADLDQALSAL